MVRRLGIAAIAFVAAWLVATLLAGWLLGSGNILVWIIAAVAGAVAYLALEKS